MKTLAGTHGYIAPELYLGLAYYKPTNIWSIGCILFEMCMLERPFVGTEMEIKDAVLNKQVQRFPKQY